MIYYIISNHISIMKLRSGTNTGVYNNTNYQYEKENITMQLGEEEFSNDELLSNTNHTIWLKHRIMSLIELLRTIHNLTDQYRITYEIWAVIHEHLDFIMSIPLWKCATIKYFKGEIKNLKKALYCLAFTPEQRTYLGYYRADLVKTLMILEGTP